MNSAAAPEKREFILAEFAALRAELNLRSKIRYQIVLFAIVTLGTVSAIALHSTTPEPMALFAYPVFAMLLAMLWAHNQRMSMRVSAYIAQTTQVYFDHRGWETFNAAAVGRRPWLDNVPVVGMLFVVAEITALLFGASAGLRADASLLAPVWLYSSWFLTGCAAVIVTAVVHVRFGRYEFRQFGMP